MTNSADLRPMTMGEVLDRSFQVLRRHLGTLFLTALVGILPILGVYATTSQYGPGATQQQMATAAALGGLFYLLMLLTLTVSWGALTQQVDQAIHGRAVGVKDGLKQGLRAFFRIVGYSILTYLALMGLLVPVGILAAIVLPLFGGGEAPGLLGVLVVVVGGIAAVAFVALYWAPIVFMGLPAVVVERLGPIKALRRAHGLGKGGRVRVAATAFVAWLIVLLPTIGLSFALGVGMYAVDPMAVGTSSTTQLYAYQVLSLLATGVTTPFMVAAMVYTYYDRRARREGYDVELATASAPHPA